MPLIPSSTSDTEIAFITSPFLEYACNAYAANNNNYCNPFETRTYSKFGARVPIFQQRKCRLCRSSPFHSIRYINYLFVEILFCAQNSRRKQRRKKRALENSFGMQMRIENGETRAQDGTDLYPEVYLKSSVRRRQSPERSTNGGFRQRAMAPCNGTCSASRSSPHSRCHSIAIFIKILQRNGIRGNEVKQK